MCHRQNMCIFGGVWGIHPDVMGIPIIQRIDEQPLSKHYEKNDACRMGLDNYREHKRVGQCPTMFSGQPGLLVSCANRTRSDANCSSWDSRMLRQQDRPPPI